MYLAGPSVYMSPLMYLQLLYPGFWGCSVLPPYLPFSFFCLCKRTSLPFNLWGGFFCFAIKCSYDMTAITPILPASYTRLHIYDIIINIKMPDRRNGRDGLVPHGSS